MNFIAHNILYCQAQLQLQLQLQLKLRLVLISFYPTTHPPGLVVKLQLEPLLSLLHQLQLQLYHLA